MLELLENDGLWVVVEEIAQSPAVTAAIGQQGVGFANQAGMVISLPLIWGYLPILTSARRRGVCDVIAGTVVTVVPPAIPEIPHRGSARLAPPA